MSLRDQLQDADTMTPEERAFAIASLLVASLLRARRSRFARPWSLVRSEVWIRWRD